MEVKKRKKINYEEKEEGEEEEEKEIEKEEINDEEEEYKNKKKNEKKIKEVIKKEKKVKKVSEINEVNNKEYLEVEVEVENEVKEQLEVEVEEENEVKRIKKRSKKSLKLTQREEVNFLISKVLKEIQLPKIFSNITVINFGEIKTIPSFYTSNKLFPIGYKCEVVIKGSNHIIVVEIVDMDEQLEFLVTVKPSNRVYMASSEKDVFRKVFYLF